MKDGIMSEVWLRLISMIFLTPAASCQTQPTFPFTSRNLVFMQNFAMMQKNLETPSKNTIFFQFPYHNNK